jgi:endonuclease/exonuclease/phosphatase (EEP) superfamily protein YafD
MTNGIVTSRRLLDWLLLFALAGPAGLSTIALGARWWWPLELCTHFRAHYLGALFVGIAICLAISRYKLAVAFGAFALFNLWLVAPLYLGGAGDEGQGTAVRVMSVNAFCANVERDRLMEYIVDVSPDVLLVMEIDGGWTTRLESLAAAYPHRIIEERAQDCFGIAMLSKLPVVDVDVGELGSEFPTIVARFERDGGTWFHFIGTHPIPPVRRYAAALRNKQLAAVAQLAASLDGPVVVAGDLNTTSWSPHFRDLLQIAGLRDSRNGFGNQPTWRSEFVWMGIAIDHVLVSPEVGVQRRWIGPDVGSDHRPVVVDLVIRDTKIASGG